MAGACITWAQAGAKGAQRRAADMLRNCCGGWQITAVEHTGCADEEDSSVAKLTMEHRTQPERALRRSQTCRSCRGLQGKTARSSRFIRLIAQHDQLS
jgi:hypothetical protein